MITGGATGLGRTIALEFGSLGCREAFCWLEMDGPGCRSQRALTETTLSSMGVDVYAARCDVRDREEVERLSVDVTRRSSVRCIISSTMPVSRTTARSGACRRRRGVR